MSIATIAHQTITALYGAYPPLSTDSLWAVNPGHHKKARYFPNMVVRGCTALNDNPLITFRAYARAETYVTDIGSVQRERPRLAGNTKIKCQKTTNIGVAYTDYSANVIDGGSATADISSLDTVANGDWVIVGGPTPFIGAAVNMNTANVNAATMTIEYWNGAWTAVANATDGTASSGATFGADGQISWDLPSDWVISTINSIESYWARLSVSAAMDTTTTITEIDLLFPITQALDVDADGDDIMVVPESQDQSLTGTLAYSGSSRIGWRFY